MHNLGVYYVVQEQFNWMSWRTKKIKKENEDLTIIESTVVVVIYKKELN